MNMKRTLSFVIICIACVATAFAQKPDRAKTELNNILLINDYRYGASTAAYKLWLLMDLTLDDIEGKAVTITETDYTQKFGKSVLCDSHNVYDLVRPLEDNKILIDEILYTKSVTDSLVRVSDIASSYDKPYDRISYTYLKQDSKGSKVWNEYNMDGELHFTISKAIDSNGRITELFNKNVSYNLNNRIARIWNRGFSDEFKWNDSYLSSHEIFGAILASETIITTKPDYKRTLYARIDEVKDSHWSVVTFFKKEDDQMLPYKKVERMIKKPESKDDYGWIRQYLQPAEGTQKLDISKIELNNIKLLNYFTSTNNDNELLALMELTQNDIEGKDVRIIETGPDSEEGIEYDLVKPLGNGSTRIGHIVKFADNPDSLLWVSFPRRGTGKDSFHTDFNVPYSEIDDILLIDKTEDGRKNITIYQYSNSGRMHKDENKDDVAFDKNGRIIRFGDVLVRYDDNNNIWKTYYIHNIDANFFRIQPKDTFINSESILTSNKIEKIIECGSDPTYAQVTEMKDNHWSAITIYGKQGEQFYPRLYIKRNIYVPEPNVQQTEDKNDEKATDEQTKGKKKGLKSSAAKALSRFTQLLTE